MFCFSTNSITALKIMIYYDHLMPA